MGRAKALSLRTLAAVALVGCHHDASRTQPGARAGDAAPLPPDADAATAAATPSSHITEKATFHLADVTLAIADLHMSTRLDDVLAKTSASVAINGTFFDEHGDPVGLAVSDGHTLGRFSSQMSGGVLWVRDWARDATAHLTATEDYREQPVAFAVQCRPRLVVESRVNIRSDDGRHAARTALCIRDAGRSLELVIARSDHGDGGPTLFQFAGELLAEGCEDALNLDGGPSTAWASAGIFSPPVAPVRHAIVVVKRR